MNLYLNLVIQEVLGLSGDDLEHAQEHVMQKDNLLITLLI